MKEGLGGGEEDAEAAGRGGGGVRGPEGGVEGLVKRISCFSAAPASLVGEVVERLQRVSVEAGQVTSAYAHALSRRRDGAPPRSRGPHGIGAMGRPRAGQGPAHVIGTVSRPGAR